MIFSDIQLSDKAIWQRYKEIWGNKSNYNFIRATLDSQDIKPKSLDADMLNALTDLIVDTEKLNDPDFLKDLIQVSKYPPTGLEEGQIYFDWTAPYSFNEVDAKDFNFEQVDELGTTWNYVNEGEW